jgi:hypothetical protein
MSSSTPVVPKSLACSEDPAVRAFYDQLSPKDQLIHTLATQMLKTRYTPQRSNAWNQWQSKQLKK